MEQAEAIGRHPSSQRRTEFVVRVARVKMNVDGEEMTFHRGDSVWLLPLESRAYLRCGAIVQVVGREFYNGDLR